MTAGALGIVALAAAGLYAAPYFISDQEARLAALRALRAATGVEPQIGGAVYLTLLPSPAVRLEEVRLTDGNRPAFTTAAIRANVQLLPLFYGHVEIASLTFEYPSLSIEAVPSGAIAVGIPMRRATASTTEDLPEVRFENGIVRFKNGDAHGEPFTGVEAAVAWSGSGVTASGSFRWRGQPATFNLSVANLAALEKGDRSNLRLRVEGEDLKLGFDGGVAYRNGVQADGTLAAEARSLRKVLSQLAATPPVTRGGFGEFKLKSQVAVASNSAALTKLAIELDGNRAEGGLTIKQAGDRAVVQATLATDHADFTPYSGGFALTDAEGRDWSRNTIDLSALELFDLDMRFSAARVTVRKTELARVAATATMRNGTLAFAVGDARFHNGALRGRASIGRNPDGTADVKIEGSVANFDLSPGLSALANVEQLEGKGTLALTLESSGPHMYALTRGLGGTVTLDAGAGALAGINVEQVLRRFERNPWPSSATIAGGRTAFDRLKARLNVYGGTARIEEAQVESPQMRIKLMGETSVVHRDFNIRGTAALVRTAAARTEPFELPFVVRGPWERPYLLPDPTGLLQLREPDAPRRHAAWSTTEERAY
jgi:AsmA protein